MFPDCVLPGCRNPVADINDACAECLSAAGPMLRRTGAPLTAEQIAERNAETLAAYAEHRVVS